MRLELLIFGLAASAVQAQDTGELPGLPVIECFCTDRTGGRVELGQTICLMVDGRAYLARCEMSQNVPAWRDTGSDCVGAGLEPGLRRLPALESKAPEGA